jgi:hypothetical protein
VRGLVLYGEIHSSAGNAREPRTIPTTAVLPGECISIVCMPHTVSLKKSGQPPSTAGLHRPTGIPELGLRFWAQDNEIKQS